MSLLKSSILITIKIIVIMCCSMVALPCISATEQTGKKVVRKKVYRTDKSISDTYDSARYYYLKAWDAYKQHDLGPARYYWERGANCKTNTPARYNCAFRLGLMHQNGEGMGVNYETAYYYYKLAYANGSKLGNVDATKIIAAYYENGLVFTQNLTEALAWYQKAKKQGNQYCDEDIARVKKNIELYYSTE
ncbi:MAG: hypothetical protein ACOVO1_10435 [Chitinophagaceae bacterium]